MTAYTPLRPDNAALVMIDHQVNFMLACQTLPAEALRTKEPLNNSGILA
jgi:hypothetical protein